jgi:phosphohistidine phosphatase
MSKKHELMLLRHGKANGGAGDYHRILTDRGIRDVQHIGEWLEQQDMIPDLIVASPAECAAGTAKKVSKVMGMAEGEIRHDDRIYATNLGTLLEVVAALPETDNRILLIGHNPGLEQLLAWLSSKGSSLPDEDKRLAPATLAIVKIADA